jgi:hypothetical protein
MQPKERLAKISSSCSPGNCLNVDILTVSGCSFADLSNSEGQRLCSRRRNSDLTFWSAAQLDHPVFVQAREKVGRRSKCGQFRLFWLSSGRLQKRKPAIGPPQI